MRHLILFLVTLSLSTLAAAQVAIDAELVPENRLVPGPGWGGPTTPVVYPGLHRDATSIAHWTRMPGQILWRHETDVFELGVLAYHRSRIAAVRFSVDDGPWLTVDRMRVSSQTEHYEYGVSMVAHDFEYGWHEVRAIAVPRRGVDLGGTERVLVWRFYNGRGDVAGIDYEVRWVDSAAGSDSDPGSELAPFATIRQAIEDVASTPNGANGAIILCMGAVGQPVVMGGSTSVVANGLPLTIRRARGHRPTLFAQDGIVENLFQVLSLRIEALDIDFSHDSTFPRGVMETFGALYLANCALRGVTYSADDFTSFARLSPYGSTNTFVVDSSFDDFHGDPGGFWVRGVNVRDSKSVGTGTCLIDSTFERCDGSGYAAVISLIGAENVLMDGVRLLDNVSNLGTLSGAAADGTAFVNSLVDGTSGPANWYELVNLFSGLHRHFLLLSSTFPGTYVEYDSNPQFNADFTNSLVSGVVTPFFNDIYIPGWQNNVAPAFAGLELDPLYIHTHASPPPWASWTGNTLPLTFVDPSNQDFRIRPASQASGRIPAAARWHDFDIDAEPRGPMTDVGCFRGQDG